jgi:hypothetical protein
VDGHARPAGYGELTEAQQREVVDAVALAVTTAGI